jgi:glycogen debranching enzyme
MQQQQQQQQSITLPPSYTNPDLEFQSTMSAETSAFLRKPAPGDPQGKRMATQVRLHGGKRPDVTVSWPAGNSGVYVGFRSEAAEAAVEFAELPQPIYLRGGMRGSMGRIRIKQSKVTIETLMAGSMQDIRQRRDIHERVLRIEMKGSLQRGALVASRASIDGLTRWEMRLRPLQGTVIRPEPQPPSGAATGAAAIIASRLEKPGGVGSWRLENPAGKDIVFELRAATDEAPLTPVPMSQIIVPETLSRSDPHDVSELAYLIYEESILAGADNYLTRFGRDNQFLLAIGGEALMPKAYEIVLASHLEAMRADGNLSHEPFIGESALTARLALGEPLSRKPVERYHMVDSRFLLAMNVPPYARKVGAARASEFFARKARDGQPYWQKLLRNFEFIIAGAEPFARKPIAKNLISIEPTERAGDWRDSNEGLGEGRYPYDVNAVFVPAALMAVDEMARIFPKDEDLAKLARRAVGARAVWREKAPALFDVVESQASVAANAAEYARELGMKGAVVHRAIGVGEGASGGPLRFSAVSLDASGAPVPIMSSDGGFLLLYGHEATDEAVIRALEPLVTPFPVGLYSPIGVFVSNGAYAPPALRKTWNFDGYHKLVVWPWQELLAVKGIDRQLSRSDLRPETMASLRVCELELWRLLYKTAGRLSYELYGARPVPGGLKAIAYGQDSSHETSAAIIQGWSKLAILVRPPARVLERLGPFPIGGRRPAAFQAPLLGAQD